MNRYQRPVGEAPTGFGTPEEIATVVAFLASDDSAFMTGCELAVDGARTQL